MNRRSVTDVARRNPWETLLLVILAGTIVFNVTQSTNYVGIDNFVNLFELSIEKVIIVVMMTFVIIAGEIDLSVASVMALSAAILARLNEGQQRPVRHRHRHRHRRRRARRAWCRGGASPGSGCRRSS